MGTWVRPEAEESGQLPRIFAHLPTQALCRWKGNSFSPQFLPRGLLRDDYIFGVTLQRGKKKKPPSLPYALIPRAGSTP
jgi:hypothetical protein